MGLPSRRIPPQRQTEEQMRELRNMIEANETMRKLYQLGLATQAEYTDHTKKNRWL
jgi:hypothetical protein